MAFPDLHNFAKTNGVPRRRSTFLIPFQHTGTINEGALFPFYCAEVLPGDTFNVKTSYVLRALRTPYVPAMNDAYLDIYYFYVPSRILWKDYTKVFGVAEPDEYTTPSTYIIPKMDFSTVVPGSVLNGLGIPRGSSINGLSVLPLAAYISIRNEWFRDQNFEGTDSDQSLIFNAASGATVAVAASWGSDICGNFSATHPSHVNRYHDVFSSCLPKPQKGNPVLLPLGTTAPVKATSAGDIHIYNTSSNTGINPGDEVKNRYSLAVGSNDKAFLLFGTNDVPGQLKINNASLVGAGAYADLSTATAASIDDLILAVSAQSYLRNLALGGSRWNELLMAEFHTAPKDATIQRPEFLGGSHKRINVQQVANTSGSGSGSTQQGFNNTTGSLGAYSLTSDSNGSFVRSFQENGYVIGVMAIRVKHRYSQGIPKHWRKLERFDHFLPDFDRIGNVPVAKDEIYAGATGTWGFQEAWYEYRSMVDQISGEVVPGFATDLQAFTYGDNYATTPSLSAQWLREDKRMDQNLTGSTSVAQFVFDIQVLNKATRPMSVNSVPSRLGL